MVIYLLLVSNPTLTLITFVPMQCNLQLIRLQPDANPNRAFQVQQTRSYHMFKLSVPYCHTDVYKYSFVPCSSRLWNSLPNHIGWEL